MTTDWRLADLPDDDEALAAHVVAVFRAIAAEGMANVEGANPALGVEVRALRTAEDWRVMLLLAPWMLARLYLPRRVPAIAVPPAWREAARADAPYVVIGPACRFSLLGAEQGAHLNHHPRLGHYLVLPIAQHLARYENAAAVFANWNAVIATRDRVMAEGRRDCPLQREVSRREFLKGG